jgi:RNA polymerase sporulation-specific sigma factor
MLKIRIRPVKTFEKPLTANEEQEYLKRYRDGDEGAGDILILRNMRLVAHMIKHYNFDEKDVEEYISIGTIGLIKAVRTFNPGKGNRLATYAAKCIDNELLMALRGEKKKNKDISLQETIGTDKEGNEINIIDVLDTGEKNFLDSFILKQDVEKMYGGIQNVLSKREKEIIVYRYGLLGHEEITQRELAEKMGISRSYVSRIEKKALEKLKNYICTN